MKTKNISLSVFSFSLLFVTLHVEYNNDDLFNLTTYKCIMETNSSENKEKSMEQTYHCNDCGNVIYKHEVFCSKCGKLLDRYDFE